MKKYQLNVHYETVITVPDIIADNEEEALRIASEKASTMSLNESEVVGENSCVTKEEDIPEKGTKAPSAAELSDNEMRSVIRQALADPDFRKMLDEELEKEKRPHGADPYDAFAYLIHIEGNGTRLDAESLVEFGWTFIGDDDECWTLPLTEIILDEKKKDITFIFEDDEARFEEILGTMPDDLRDALVEEFGDWL